MKMMKLDGEEALGPWQGQAAGARDRLGRLGSALHAALHGLVSFLRYFKIIS